MADIPIGLIDPIPNVKCLECGKEFEYDPYMGWGCLTLMDDRNAPKVIVGAWCDKTCLGKWFNKAEARKSLVRTT